MNDLDKIKKWEAESFKKLDDIKLFLDAVEKVDIEGNQEEQLKTVVNNLEKIKENRVDSPEKETPLKKLSVSYLDVIGIALIVAFLSVTVYDHFFASKVVVVDLTGFVKEQKELFIQGRIGEADVAERLAQFQKFVKKQPKNLTVITKDVVLANGREVSFSMGNAEKSPSDPEKK